MQIRAMPVLAVVGLMACVLASDAHAQAVPAPFLHVSLGIGNSTGGDYEEREDYVAELLLAAPVRKRVPRGVIAGLLLGSTFINGSNLTCRLAFDGGCVPLMPRFGYAAALVGYERSGLLGTAGITVGPAAAFTVSSSLYPSLYYRADLTTPAVQRIALAISARGIAVSRVAGSTLLLRSVSLGVRLR